MSTTTVLLQDLQRYQYKPLPTHEKFIRLVLVFPRDPSNPASIRICILPSPLDAARRVWPDFQALSYVWGDPNDRRDLIVLPVASDSDPEEAHLPTLLSVTANLAEAIRYFPYPDKHIVFWIDAICINQGDLAERAQQVTLMGEIYASASGVYAWLGPPSEDSNLAMNLLYRIGESVGLDDNSYEIRPRESAFTRASAMSKGYTDLLCDLRFPIPWDGPEAQALERLFYRPWFERLWIRQEITLGGDRAGLVCGGSSIEWSVFRKAAVLLNQKIKDHNHPRYEQWVARTELVADVCVHARVWLGQLLRQIQKAECTDPRDRVYGILGILPPESRAIAGKIKPNYTKPVAEVYKDFVLAAMEVTGRADLLSECFLPADNDDDDDESSRTRDWRPSWVPNWSSKREKGFNMNQLCADGQSSVAGGWYVEDDAGGGGVLRIKGVRVDEVTTVMPTPKLTVDTTPARDGDDTPAAFVPPILDFIKRICATLDVSPEDRAPYGPLGSSSGSGNGTTTVLEAICYALSGGGHFRDHLSEQMAASTTPSLHDFRELIRHALAYKMEDASTHRPPSPHTSACLKLMVSTVQDRAIFLTSEGYVGVGPAAMRPGDEIAVLLGCMRPLVLRPQQRGEREEAPQRHRVIVGPCNAHGLDWGEALLGPLPENVDFVWSHAGQSYDVGPAFRKKRKSNSNNPEVALLSGRSSGEARDEAGLSDSEEEEDKAHFSGDDDSGDRDYGNDIGIGSSSSFPSSSRAATAARASGRRDELGIGGRRKGGVNPTGPHPRPERETKTRTSGINHRPPAPTLSPFHELLGPLLQMDADVPSLNHLRGLVNAMGGSGSDLGTGVGRSASFDDDDDEPEEEEEEEEEESVNDPRLKWDFLKTLDRERAWVWRKSLVLPSFPSSYLSSGSGGGGGGVGGRHGEDNDGGYTMFRRPDAGYFGRVGVELTEFFLV